jgi:stearoyl-CoA desaturase (delta-9 desaturase)
MVDVERARAQGWRKIYFNWATIPYWGVHVGAVAGIAMLGFSWAGLGVALASYYARMFFVTGAYHRYFSHRSFKTSRVFQFILALGAVSAVQKGVLWWAAHHRRHHKFSDQPDDPHSPVQGGFWWSHMGWILCRDMEGTDYERVKDLARYRELVWLDKGHWVVEAGVGVACYLIGGWWALVWAFLVATTLLWHGTFTINSLSHVIGGRRYDTSDDSRNHPILALVTMGEGWHNNHHHYQSSCRQGFRWYEIDLTYYVLKVLSWFRIVWDVRVPPRHIVENRPATDDPAQPGDERFAA